jgi:hypothetical protein
MQSDNVNHPKHYTSHPSGIECIQITRYMSFNIGNAVKYLWRVDQKDNAIEDLEKAVWYINDEIARRKVEQLKAERAAANSALQPGSTDS